MKKYNLLIITAALMACGTKEKPVIDAPAMIYTDLKNTSVKQGQAFHIDLDKDGTRDLSFGTWDIGSPMHQENRVLFYAESYIHTLLLMDTTNESTPVYNPGDLIALPAMPAHHQWYPVSLAELAKKHIPDMSPVYWDGIWKQASHRYMGIKITKGNQWYAGWIELSFNTATEQIVLHKAAISKMPYVPVTAGR